MEGAHVGGIQAGKSFLREQTSACHVMLIINYSQCPARTDTQTRARTAPLLSAVEAQMVSFLPTEVFYY